MLKLLIAALLIFFTFSGSAQQNYVTLHEDCNYAGKRSMLQAGIYRYNQMKIDNDKLSCMQIPAGMKVTVYEHDNFKGRSKTFTSNVPCLDEEWNDMTSSIVVENTSYQPGYNSNNYIVFYNDCNYKGYSRSLKPGTYSARALGTLVKNISSFTIYGNLKVRVYLNNDNASGYSYTLTKSEDCLSGLYNDKIRSMVIEYNNDNNYNNYNNYGNNSYATIYTDCNYRGNSLRLEPGYYRGDKLGLLKFNISSIELPSNLRAKVYINNENLSGNYYTITENNRCLSNTMNNRIGSLIIEATSNTSNYNPQNNESGVIIYSDGDYKGQSVFLLPGTYATMTQVGFPDNALSSLYLPDGYRVVLYEFENFRGKSYTINKTKPGFLFSGWNDKTSSIAVYRDR